MSNNTNTNTNVTDLDLVNKFPKYIAGAIRSQSHNILMRSKEDRQLLCFSATVAFYQKYTERWCTASLKNLIARYNDIAPRFGLKLVKQSSFEKILRKAKEEGLVIKDPDSPFRILKIVISEIERLCSAAFKKAAYHAKQLFDYLCKSGGQDVGNVSEDSKFKGSEENCEKKNTDIIEEISKDKIYKNNRQLPKDFFANQFKGDAQEANQLQGKASHALKLANEFRHKHFNAYNAFRLIQLHKKHNVKLGIAGFCKYVIYKCKKEAEKKKSDRQAKRLHDAGIKCHQEMVAKYRRESAPISVQSSKSKLVELGAKGFMRKLMRGSK